MLFWLGIGVTTLAFLLELGPMQRWVKKRWNWLRDQHFHLGSVVLFASGMAITIGAHSMEEREAEGVRRELGRIDRDTQDVQQFAPVARLGFTGLEENASGGFGTVVSDWGYDRDQKQHMVSMTQDGKITFSCTPQAVTIYRAATQKFTWFPFPFVTLAACLQRVDDPAWRSAATQAYGILEKTTKVPGHRPSHDAAKAMVESMLNQAPEDSTGSSK